MRAQWIWTDEPWRVFLNVSRETLRDTVEGAMLIALCVVFAGLMQGCGGGDDGGGVPAAPLPAVRYEIDPTGKFVNCYDATSSQVDLTTHVTCEWTCGVLADGTTAHVWANFAAMGNSMQQTAVVAQDCAL